MTSSTETTEQFFHSLVSFSSPLDDLQEEDLMPTKELHVSLTALVFAGVAGLRAHGRRPGAAVQSGEHARPGLGAEEEPVQGRAGAEVADT